MHAGGIRCDAMNPLPHLASRVMRPADTSYTASGRVAAPANSRTASLPQRGDAASVAMF